MTLGLKTQPREAEDANDLIVTTGNCIKNTRNQVFGLDAVPPAGSPVAQGRVWPLTAFLQSRETRPLKNCERNENVFFGEYSFGGAIRNACGIPLT